MKPPLFLHHSAARRSADQGLLANGASGAWEISIKESTAGREGWFLQIDGPSISFMFEMATPKIAEEMLRFLSGPPCLNEEGCSPLFLGREQTTAVVLVRDDEFADRFFLVVGPENEPIVRCVIAGSNLTDIAEALRQVNENLDDAA